MATISPTVNGKRCLRIIIYFLSAWASAQLPSIVVEQTLETPVGDRPPDHEGWILSQQKIFRLA
ncbi:MAG: hypothetical protein F6K00_03785 [Leptolyngbya sp. SIOISBB]|nr:hypothetical protein [Leptolyngbya sp. SIOISBB]